MNSLSQWLLTHYGKEQYNPGLERIGFALRPVRVKFQDCKVVTIAGTNGKGETALRLSNHLKDHRFCTWTSPHIERITERFRCEEGEISLSELTELIYECHEKVVSHKFQLTYYEFLFFVFCTWAAARRPEFLILEVGLGGRLDAVNVFDADLVLIPSISRDHQEYLGNRYDLILEEKLGVLRPGSVLLTCLELVYLQERAKLKVEQIGARLIDLQNKYQLPKDSFTFRNQFLAHAAYCQLMGQVLEKEKFIPEGALEHRGEKITLDTEWVFFGSHNPDGIRKLIQFLHSENYNLPRMSFDAVIVAFSERRKSDLEVMLKMIKASGLKNIKVTCFDHPKAASKELMECLSGQEGLEFVEDIDSYVQGANSTRILVTGSYYFLGYIKSLLRR